MDDQNTSSQEQDGLAGEVLDSIGVNESNEEQQDAGSERDSELDPLYVQKRLKQQKRSHERELRARDQQINELYSRMNDMQSSATPQSDTSQMSGQNVGNDIEGHIHKAVAYALNHRDEEERRKREADKMQHVHKQYGELQRHLDNTSDKYDDFDDIVRGNDAPFTEHMRDAALLLPRSGSGAAGEVLYKLGKNREELERIKNLHPLDQAAEMVKLSHALVNGANENRAQSSQRMGNIKSNPITNTAGISEKTSVGELRKRMQQGGKRWS